LSVRLFSTAIEFTLANCNVLLPPVTVILQHSIRSGKDQAVQSRGNCEGQKLNLFVSFACRFNDLRDPPRRWIADANPKGGTERTPEPDGSGFFVGR